MAGQRFATEVAPVLWTPNYLGSRSSRWARQELPTLLNFVIRWLIRFTPAGRREELAREFEPTAQYKAAPSKPGTKHLG
jgi:hypothetical protein